MTRYHSVFAPNARARKAVTALAPLSSRNGPVPSDASAQKDVDAAPSKRPSRHLWADLLRKVFAIDILRCPCGQRRKVIGSLSRAHSPEALAAFLAAIGESKGPLPIAPARPPPQQDFDWDTPDGEVGEAPVFDDFAHPPAPDC